MFLCLLHTECTRSRLIGAQGVPAASGVSSGNSRDTATTYGNHTTSASAIRLYLRLNVTFARPVSSFPFGKHFHHFICLYYQTNLSCNVDSEEFDIMIVTGRSNRQKHDWALPESSVIVGSLVLVKW